MDWLTGWFEHDEVQHAAWLGAAGTTVAAAFGVAAFIWQVLGSAQRAQEARRAQARKVWFLMGPVSFAVVTSRVSTGQVTVTNDSDQVISWVTVEFTPIHQSKDGTITRVPHQPTEKDLTRQTVSLIGPGGHWLTDAVSIEVPKLKAGPDDMWLIECTLIFDDAAGLRWSRTGEAQPLKSIRKTWTDRRAERDLMR